MNNKEFKLDKHKILSVIGVVLCVILGAMLVMNITLILKSWFNQDEVPSIGGNTPLIVLSPSMEPEIKEGDLIVVHTVDAAEVEIGDVIAFFDPASQSGAVLTHQVVDIRGSGDSLEFQTKGIANNGVDPSWVSAKDLIGRYDGVRFGGLGKVAMFMQTTEGLIVSVVLPLAAFVAYDLIRRRNSEQKSADDTTALLAELEALRAEKARLEQQNSERSDKEQ